jgi:D-alanyl-D-alanine carboxypeptidase/D-alanyl-D-alanine-endopeptidase (penicillin-binding protein 4)
MKRFSGLGNGALILLISQFIACAPARQLRTASAGNLAELRARLDQILADSALARSRTGIKVVSLRSGDTLYERDSHLLFHPASNQKLLTSAAALAVLGPAFEFSTRVAYDSGAVKDSTIVGNMYLIGGGNPDLTTAELFELSQKLRQAGLRHVTGDLICDDFYFDDVRWGSGWMWDDDPSPDFSRFTALTVNDNAITVSVAPGDSLGALAKVTLEPSTDFVQVVNTSVTTLDEDSTRKDSSTTMSLQTELPLRIDRRWQHNENTIVVDGAISIGAPLETATVNLLYPEVYAGTLFREVLQSAGIILRGRVARGLAPPRPQILAEHRQPLLPTLINLNKVSDNLSAELILKTIGAEKFGRRGSAERGLRAMRLFLSSVGVDTLSLQLADGSGVSRYNLITPAAIVGLLTAMWQDFKLGNEFVATLPIAGVDGTLERRMQSTLAAGVIHAKTGSLSGVSTLSGYTATMDGEELAFSIMMQPFLGSASAVRRVQDKICAELCSFNRGQASQ